MRKLLVLLLFGSLLALAQKEAKITSWGTHRFALDAGSPGVTRPVTIVASDTKGRGGLRGKVRYMEALAGAWVQGNVANVYQIANLKAGNNYQTTIYYDPSGHAFIHFRVFASQGNIFNQGRLILTDTPDYNRQNAQTLYGEVSANGGIPAWQALLGVVLWITGYGIPVAAALLGTTSGTTTFTYAVPAGTGATIYYKMTGCTAFGDYNGSFTIPANLTPGAVYGVDVHGWCGGGGIGNWARANQKVVLPGELLFIPRTTFSDPNVPGYALVFDMSTRFHGPDDCGGYYEDGYDPQGGIHYKLSGADCWATGFGAPGDLGSVRTFLPSLTVHFRYIQARLSGFTVLGTDIASKISSRLPHYAPTSPNTVSAIYTPPATYRGNVYESTRTGTASAGGETVTGSGVVYNFSFSAIWSIGSTNLVDTFLSLNPPTISYTFPNYTGTCTVKNITTDKTLTIYELTPPQTFSGRPGEARQVSFPRKILPPGGTNTLGKGGLYYMTTGSGPAAVGHISLSGSGCSTITNYSTPGDTFKAGFFGIP